MISEDPSRIDMVQESALAERQGSRKRRELQIALAEAEREFGERLAARDPQGMKACHERMAYVEDQMLNLDVTILSEIGPAAASTADRLMSSLEASTNTPTYEATIEQDTNDKPANDTGSLHNAPPAVTLAEFPELEADSALARKSIVRAMEVATERSQGINRSVGEFDQEVQAAFALKKMVDHTNSFMTLFLDPQAFIKNQLAQRSTSPTDAADRRPTVARASGIEYSDNKPVVEESTKNPNLESVQIRDRQELAKKLNKFSLYEILSVDETASAAVIHEAYLTKLGQVKTRANNGLNTEPWRLEEFKRALSRAETVLSDIKSRRNYDLSLTGLIDFEHADASQIQPTADQDFSPDVKLDMPKLLVFAGVLTIEELTGVDAANYNSDVELADQLVKLDLITYEEYNAAVLARNLIEKGKLSLGQTRFAFRQMRNDSVRFIDTLVAEGWLSSSDLPRG